MYCQSCGTSVSPGLSYCNRCGARLSDAKADLVPKPSEIFPDSLVWAIVTIFIVGLGSIMGLMAIMKKLDMNDGLINGLSLLTFFLMAGVEFVFVWLLINRSRDPRRNAVSSQSKTQRRDELDGERRPALPEPAISVTENTTRSFDPSRIGREPQ